MDCDNVEIKQQYLRSEIIDKGYDPQKFSEFLGTISDKGLDIEAWSIDELGEAVHKFQECENERSQNKDTNDNGNEASTSDDQTGTVQSHTNTGISTGNNQSTAQYANQSEGQTAVKTEEFIPCKKQERNTLTDMSNIEIIISE